MEIKWHLIVQNKNYVSVKVNKDMLQTFSSTLNKNMPMWCDHEKKPQGCIRASISNRKKHEYHYRGYSNTGLYFCC